MKTRKLRIIIAFLGIGFLSTSLFVLQNDRPKEEPLDLYYLLNNLYYPTTGIKHIKIFEFGDYYYTFERFTTSTVPFLKDSLLLTQENINHIIKQVEESHSKIPPLDFNKIWKIDRDTTFKWDKNKLREEFEVLDTTQVDLVYQAYLDGGREAAQRKERDLFPDGYVVTTCPVYSLDSNVVIFTVIWINFSDFTSTDDLIFFRAKGRWNMKNMWK